MSDFPWGHNAIKFCYLLEGGSEITQGGDEIVAFGEGDFVTSPTGVNCRRVVRKAVKNHYEFM